MRSILQNLKNIFKRELVILWIFSVLFSFALVVFENKNKLPLGAGDFVFLTIIVLLVALYRPRWIFFIFVSLIPLENIILASGFLPFQLRPYQYFGAALIIAVIILYAFKKIRFKLMRLTWIDWAIFSFCDFLRFLSDFCRQIRRAFL